MLNTRLFLRLQLGTPALFYMWVIFKYLPFYKGHIYTEGKIKLKKEALWDNC